MQSLEKLPLEEVLAGAANLYSVPAVAMEVLRLSDEPGVDAQALHDCIERDPALTAKLLRVVNSSLYGLNGKVADLNQAIALMGVNPLKLLVLGFSLPDELFEGRPIAALRRYWTQTITRAAAAREIAQTFWGKQGDEAFIAGLLQGIGQLVLLDQLGVPYAALLDRLNGFPTKTSDEIAAVEFAAVGFEHRVLSAELLDQWALPKRLAQAIRQSTDPSSLGQLPPEEACLPQSLRLADLVMQLVERKLLSALPDLVEEGERYCRMSRRGLNDLVVRLEPKVAQLASALAVDINGVEDYSAILLEAQAKMSVVAEETISEILSAAASSSEDVLDAAGEEVLAEARELSTSIQAFLGRDKSREVRKVAEPTESPEKNGSASVRPPHHVKARESAKALASEAQRQVEACRNERQPLAVAMIQVEGGDLLADNQMTVIALRRWVMASDWAEELKNALWIGLAPDRLALLLPNYDRHTAVKLFSAMNKAFVAKTDYEFDAGVAAVELAPKGFDSSRLIEAAERCLDAAQATGAPTVKSIEVY